MQQQALASPVPPTGCLPLEVAGAVGQQAAWERLQSGDKPLKLRKRKVWTEMVPNSLMTRMRGLSSAWGCQKHCMPPIVPDTFVSGDFLYGCSTSGLSSTPAAAAATPPPSAGLNWLTGTPFLFQAGPATWCCLTYALSWSNSSFSALTHSTCCASLLRNSVSTCRQAVQRADTFEVSWLVGQESEKHPACATCPDHSASMYVAFCHTGVCNCQRMQC